MMFSKKPLQGSSDSSSTPSHEKHQKAAPSQGVQLDFDRISTQTILQLQRLIGNQAVRKLSMQSTSTERIQRVKGLQGGDRVKVPYGNNASSIYLGTVLKPVRGGEAYEIIFDNEQQEEWDADAVFPASMSDEEILNSEQTEPHPQVGIREELPELLVDVATHDRPISETDSGDEYERESESEGEAETYIPDYTGEEPEDKEISPLIEDIANEKRSSTENEEYTPDYTGEEPEDEEAETSEDEETPPLTEYAAQWKELHEHYGDHDPQVWEKLLATYIDFAEKDPKRQPNPPSSDQAHQPIPLNERSLVAVAMKQGVAGYLGEYKFTSTEPFYTCSAIIMFNANTRIGGLFHFAAYHLDQQADALTDMFRDIMPTEIRIYTAANAVHLDEPDSMDTDRHNVMAENQQLREFFTELGVRPQFSVCTQLGITLADDGGLGVITTGAWGNETELKSVASQYAQFGN